MARQSGRTKMEKQTIISISTIISRLKFYNTDRAIFWRAVHGYQQQHAVTRIQAASMIATYAFVATCKAESAKSRKIAVNNIKQYAAA